jgi:hypothetical protein
MMLSLCERWEWVDHRQPMFVDQWGEVFGGYVRGRHWFILVEVAVSVATAVLAGLAASGGAVASCGAIRGLAVAVDGSFLLCILLLRPYNTPYDHAMQLINAAATALSSLLGTAGVDTSALTAAQAVLNLVTTAVTLAVAIGEGRARALAQYLVSAWRSIREGVRMTATSYRHRRYRQTSRAGQGWGNQHHQSSQDNNRHHSVVNATGAVSSRRLLLQDQCRGPAEGCLLLSADDVRERYLGMLTRYAHLRFGPSDSSRLALTPRGVAATLEDIVRIICSVMAEKQQLRELQVHAQSRALSSGRERESSRAAAVGQ